MVRRPNSPDLKKKRIIALAANMKRGSFSCPDGINRMESSSKYAGSFTGKSTMPLWLQGTDLKWF